MLFSARASFQNDLAKTQKRTSVALKASSLIRMDEQRDVSIRCYKDLVVCKTEAKHFLLLHQTLTLGSERWDTTASAVMWSGGIWGDWISYQKVLIIFSLFGRIESKQCGCVKLDGVFLQTVVVDTRSYRILQADRPCVMAESQATADITISVSACFHIIDFSSLLALRPFFVFFVSFGSNLQRLWFRDTIRHRHSGEHQRWPLLSASLARVPCVRLPRLLILSKLTLFPVLRRQDDLGDCSNGTYAAPNGLGFNISCFTDIQGKDLSHNTGSDLDDCMNQCSSLQPLCYGVTWDGTNCWFMNSGAKQAGLYSTKDTHTALTNLTQITPLDTNCPFANMSNQTTSVGYHFQIECGDDYPGSDLPNSSVHKESLQDCMEECAGWHDLCKAVAFNPAMTSGYQNCYLKNNNDPSGVKSSDKNFVALGITPFVTSYNRSCSENTTYTSSNKTSHMEKTFNINCNFDRVGDDIIQVRKEDFDGCIDACANYYNSTIPNGPTCQAVVFNAASNRGYLNCFLKGSQQALSPSNDFDAAVFVNAVNNGTAVPSPTESSKPSSGHSSKAWIAGPVLGVIAAFAIGAAVAWWCRGRGKRYKQPPQEDTPDVPVTRPETSAYPPTVLVEADNTEHKVEADSDQVHELEGVNVQNNGPRYV